jgi:hypothetical protein
MEWVDVIFNWAVHALGWMARLLGITYEEINVWLFCIAWRFVTFCLFLGFIFPLHEYKILRSIIANQVVIV